MKKSLQVFILCLSIILNSCRSDKDQVEREVTWSKDIAKILFKNCSPCHRPGQSAPFNILSYTDAVKKSKLIRFVTQSGYMPPWPADNLYSHFVGERVLSEDEKQKIKTWVDQGVQRGDSLKEPHAPVFYNGSYFGKPDLTIRLKEAVKIKGNGTDAFLILKFPYQLPNDTVLDYVEFVPAQYKLVHHVNGHMIAYDEKREFNYTSGKDRSEDTRSNLLELYQTLHIPYTDKLQPNFPTLTPNVVYYLPGFIPPAYPKEMGGYHMKKNGLFLLNNIHYGPSNKDVLDSSYLNIFFRKSEIKRPIKEAQMGTFGISKIEPEFIIPPNEVKTFHTQFTLPSSISMLSVNPHMHLTGQKFLAFALKQNGDTIPLIKINKWDFRWQYYYTFKNPVKLEKGITIHVYGTFDNTAQNPNNPFQPPRAITQGNGVESMKTTEEMFQFIFTYVSYKEGDEEILLQR